VGHGGDGDRNQDLTLVTLRVRSEAYLAFIEMTCLGKFCE